MTGDTRQANWARQAEAATFFDLKATVANILARLGIDSKETVLEQKPADDIYAAYLSIATRSGKQLGTMGILSKAVLKSADIKQDVVYAELEWDALVRLASKKKVTFTPLPKTLPVKRDLALLVDNTVSFAQIEAVVRESEKRLLRGVSLFDVYEGKNLPAGKKSYAITILLQDDEKTLQDKQIDSSMERVITNLRNKLGAELR